jgi:hypothetical protein
MVALSNFSRNELKNVKICFWSLKLFQPILTSCIFDFINIRFLSTILFTSFFISIFFTSISTSFIKINIHFNILKQLVRYSASASELNVPLRLGNALDHRADIHKHDHVARLIKTGNDVLNRDKTRVSLSGKVHLFPDEASGT